MDIIYLQQLENVEAPDDTGRTWCEDKINDNDDVYIKKDVVLELIQAGWNIITCHNQRWNPKESMKSLEEALLNKNEFDAFRKYIKEVKFEL